MYEPQCYDPMNMTEVCSDKVRLQNLGPQTIMRCAMVRAKEAKVIGCPKGQSELYVYKSDSRKRKPPTASVTLFASYASPVIPNSLRQAA